jgi:hypothetical protein
MSKPRSELNAKFKEILGNNNVYFQPPESVKLKYDCIIYKDVSPYTRAANNYKYILQHKYQITYITSNPVSPIVDKMLHEFQMIDRVNDFVSDGLYHYVYELYF